jgi:hypothetical protein
VSTFHSRNALSWHRTPGGTATHFAHAAEFRTGAPGWPPLNGSRNKSINAKSLEVPDRLALLPFTPRHSPLSAPAPGKGESALPGFPVWLIPYGAGRWDRSAKD